MKKIILLISLLSGIALVVVFFPSDKKRIMKVVDSGRKAVVNEELKNFMDIISFNYNDDFGGNYINMKKRMESLFKQFENFDITLDVLGLSVNEDNAAAELKLSVIASEGEYRGYLIGDAEGGQDVKVNFGKSPYKWKVVKIEGFEKSGRTKDSIGVK
jgi:hypothetical protein